MLPALQVSSAPLATFSSETCAWIGNYLWNGWATTFYYMYMFHCAHSTKSGSMILKKSGSIIMFQKLLV